MIDIDFLKMDRLNVYLELFYIGPYAHKSETFPQQPYR